LSWTPERIRIWRNMSPTERDYDRMIAGSYPPLPGASQLETAEARDYWMEEQSRSFDEHICMCQVSPPCSHCTDCPECNCEACDDWHDTVGGETCPLLEEN
jgi:hypothetical protein